MEQAYIPIEKIAISLNILTMLQIRNRHQPATYDDLCLKQITKELFSFSFLRMIETCVGCRKIPHATPCMGANIVSGLSSA